MTSSKENMSHKILPGFIPPLEDELFSSWFVRLSHSHRVKTYTFSKFYFDNTPIWNRDIDKLFPKIIIERLKEYTVLNYEEIRDMFLVSYRDIIFNNESLNSFTSGILNIGVYHRKRIRFGLLCCPSCLKEEVPYFRKQWRISFSFGCSKCNCNLIDKCPCCGSAIVFHRLETGDKEHILKYPLYLCWFCKHDLRKSVELYASNSELAKYQKYIDDTIHNGYNNITSYSFTFFSTLYHLKNKLLTSSKQWNRIKTAVENYFKIQISKKTDKKTYLPFEQRKEGYLLAFKILSKWPENFKKVFQGSNVRYSDFSKDFDNMPFWFVKEIKKLT